MTRSAPPFCASRTARRFFRAVRSCLAGSGLGLAAVAALAVFVGLVAPRAAAAAEPAPAAAQAPAGPAVLTVTLTPARSTLVLGADVSTTMTVTVAGPGAETATAGRTQATVGAVDPLVPAGTPGTFTTTYHVPPDRRPQAALVSAEVVVASGARAHATTLLLLPAATTFPFRTSPNAVVSLEVDGHAYGPVTADAAGNVGVPIVVPPGLEHGRARARAPGRYGGTKETEVNLQPRDFPRLLLFAPPAAEAGATVDVEAHGVEPTGEPVDPEDIDLRATPGAIRRIEGRPGVARFLVTLPEDASAATVALRASMSDGSSERSDAMSIHAGPAARLLVASSASRLHVGLAEVSRLTVRARDRLGNDVAPAGVAVTVDGQPLPVRLDAGTATAEVPAPATWSGRERMTVAATLGALAATREIPLTGGEPASLKVTPASPTVVADGRAGVDLLMEIVDARGTPTSSPRVAWKTESDGSLEAPGSPRLGAYSVRFVPARALHDRAALITVVAEPNLSGTARVAVETAPARSVTARVGVVTNAGRLFGETAFLEGTLPLPGRGRLGRLLSLGVSIGYLHSEITSSPAAPILNAVHVDIDQIPIAALARLHLPLQLPVEISTLAEAGATWVSTETIGDSGDGAVLSRGGAWGFVATAGADLTYGLDPGEVVLGARYMWVALPRLSSGDTLRGNVGGLICDLGFKLPF